MDERMEPPEVAGAPDNTAAAPPGKAPGGRKRGPELREAAIAAAMDLMETSGLDAVQARVIAERIGVSVGTLYNVFPHLDDLIRVVNGRTYDELFAIEWAALGRAREAGRDAHGQMLALAGTYLDFVRDHKTRWQGTLAFNRRQAEPPPQWYRDKELALLRIIEDVIEDSPGAADAGVRHLHALALWASIHGIVTIAVTDGFRRQPVEVVWRQIEIVVGAVAAKLQQKQAA